MNQPNNHVRFIIGCITLIAMTGCICGAWLLWKGFAGGGELVMTVNTAIAGMIGFLSNQPKPPTTTPSGALAAEITNTPKDPVKTEEVT